MKPETAVPLRSGAQLKGHARPRLAPPLPLKHDLAALRAEAERAGIVYMPWQERATRYITARGPDGRHLYSEVAVVAARQNGKTTLIKPVILHALRNGKRVMHIAQSRELPRRMFNLIADALSNEPDLFPKRRGRTIWPRYGAGQEEIQLLNAGEYRIAAASTGGARGWSNDLVIIDELREFSDLDTQQAVESTMIMSPDPQIIYLSNAGSERSIWLNGIRARREDDPSLAYLEWSAAPDRDPDDRRGWAEANPAMGQYPSVLRELEKAHLRHLLADTMSQFETENLCRWVISMEAPVVSAKSWARARAELAPARRPGTAINMDPSGTRASAVAAWAQPDGSMAVRLVADVRGEPVPLEEVGPLIKRKAKEIGSFEVAFDPWTDGDLARYFQKSRAINGREYAQACASFAMLVESGRLHWDDESAEIGEDLRWTTRRDGQAGSWMAVKATDGRPITAALAAIRAVWLASAPTASGSARIY